MPVEKNCKKSEEAKQMTFEEKCKKLEDIVLRLEKGSIGLEEGARLFDEGVVLAKDCYKMLETVKGKIITVRKKVDEIILEENDDE